MTDTVTTRGRTPVEMVESSSHGTDANSNDEERNKLSRQN